MYCKKGRILNTCNLFQVCSMIFATRCCLNERCKKYINRKSIKCLFKNPKEKTQKFKNKNKKYFFLKKIQKYMISKILFAYSNILYPICDVIMENALVWIYGIYIMSKYPFLFCKPSLKQGIANSYDASL